MSKNFYLIIISFLFSTLSHAQMIGGTGPGDPSPREVSAGGVNVGTVSNSVNSFTGTLDLSHTLGTVSTVSGPSFTLSMSYSSSIMSGGIQQDMKGAPFGDGWSLNIPRISVSIEDLEKYNECQRDYFNSPSNSNNSRGNMFYTRREIQVEGDLYWFDPVFSIPGVGSGRLVYKYSRGSYHYFVPQNFESPVEFRMNQFDFVWVVTTVNGDKYTFSPYPTYRQASQIRIHPSSFNMDAYGGFFYGRYYKDIVKPKIEIAEWVCKSITNSMSVERITFKYLYYGDMINMFQQFDQACFEESQYEMPKMYQGYILDQISSTLDILDLEYGNLYEDETQNCDEDDLFFCKELIYDSQTTDSGDKWMRYKHAASVSLSGSGLSGGDGFHNSSDPYRSSSFGYRLDEPETLGAAFNHGWLESPRLPSNKFTEGDYYEVAVDINNNSSNLFFDINIASGENLNAPAAPSSFPPTGTGQLAGYTDTRGWSLHSTFSNPVKWYDRAPGYGIDRTFKTTFLMPKLLDENGIYIQIGPANSDNSFDMPPNVVHWDGIRGPGYNIFDASGSAFPFASYFNYYPAVSGNLLGGEHVGTPEEFGTGNEGLGLYPTDPMPSKFGVGLPWHMMLPFYGREIQGGTFTNIPDLWTILAYTGAPIGTSEFTYSFPSFWWRHNNAPYLGDNNPTLADENVSLSRVRIYRYKRKPVVLKAVKHYAVNISEEVAPDYGNYSGAGYEVSNMGFKYDEFDGTRFAEVCGEENSITPISGEFRILRLREIVQLPIGHSSSQTLFDENSSSDFPTSRFDYSPLSEFSGEVYGMEWTDFNGGTYSFPILSNFQHQVISKIISPLGAETIISYSDFGGDPNGCNSYVEAVENSAFINGYTECGQFQNGGACGTSAPSGTIVPKQSPFTYSINLLVDHLEIKENGQSVFYDFRCFNSHERKDRYTAISENLNDSRFPSSLSRSHTSHLGFDKTWKIGPLNALSPGASLPRTEFEFYTDGIRWGKSKTVTSINANGQPLTETTSVYESILAFEPGYLRDSDRYQDCDYLDYIEYPEKPNIRDFSSLASYTEAIMSSSSSDILDGFETPTINEDQKFFTFDFQDPHDDPDSPFSSDEPFKFWEENQIRALSSYFVKLVSQTTTTSDYADCSQANQISSYEETVSYEYYEAAHDGTTNSSSFDKLPNIGFFNSKGDRQLFWEPSFLPSKITKSNSASLTTTTEELFYFWDLKNSVDYHGNEFGHLDREAYPLLFLTTSIINGPRIKRDMIYEKRTSWGGIDGTTSQSEFYQYSPDIPIARVDEVIVNIDSPDLSCGSIIEIITEDNSPGQPDENGCIFWRGDYIEFPPGYCETQTHIYCPCEYDMIYDGIGIPEDSPAGIEHKENLKNAPPLKNLLRLEATYIQIAPAEENNNLTLVNFHANGIVEPVFSVDVLRTSLVHQQNILGQAVITEDSKGLISHFLYDLVQVSIWDYCWNGYLIENVTSALSRNVGLPIAVTVGAPLDLSGTAEPPEDALTTQYTYYPNKQVETITDPNGIVTKYEYDEFNRLWKTYRNDQLIAENEYSNWDNSQSDDFLQRASKNFVRTKTFLDDNHYGEVTAFVDPLGRSIGEVSNVVNSNGANTGSVITSNHYFDIFGRIAASSPPTPGSTPGLLPAAVNDIGLINFELDIAPRSRAVTTAKPGQATDGDFTVDNQYCLVSQSTAADEIIAAGNNAGAGILPSLSFYMKTVTTDEDGKEVISFTDAAGLTLATIAGNGTAATVFEYDERGLLTRYINPLEQEVVILRNYFGYPYRKTSPDEGTMDFSYDLEGKPLTTKDGAGKLTTLKYDRFGRAIAQIDGGDPGIAFENEGMPWVDQSDPISFINSYTNDIFTNDPLEKTWQYNTFTANNETDLDQNPSGGTPGSNNALGLLVGTYSYNDSDQIIERRSYTYTTDGFIDQEQVRFSENGDASNSMDYSIHYLNHYRTGQARTTAVDIDMDGSYDYEQRVELDGRGQIYQVFASVPDQGVVNAKIAEYEYWGDNLMVQKRKMYGLDGSTIFDEILYKYDDRDRLTLINSGLFSEQLSYDATSINGSEQNYNGNINGVQLTYNFSSTPQGQALFSGPTTYGYLYDDFNRLTFANADVGIADASLENVDGDLAALGDVSFTYDLIGNITAISRSVLVDDRNAIGHEVLTFNLNQADNKIIDVTVEGNVLNEGTFTYDFDGAGNLKEDNRKGISDLSYTRGKYTAKAAGTSYLYDINDARIYKAGPTENTFYLRNGGGQELATIDLSTDEPTWYIYGLDRVAKIGPEGSLCDPPLCRPSAPEDINANITASGMLALFNGLDTEELTFPATLFRLQLADDQDYYVLDRELALLPSRFNILQQIVIYSPTELLEWRTQGDLLQGGSFGSISVIDFLEDRNGLPTTYLLNDYHVCDEVCLTDVFQCDEDTKDKQADYLSDAYTEATGAQIDFSSDQHLYRVRLCGGQEVYVMESHLAGLEKSFIVVQDIAISDYSTQIFEYSLNGTPQQPTTLASLLVNMYNPAVDIHIDNYEPCTVEPVCVDENPPCTSGFNPEDLEDELLGIAQFGPSSQNGLVFPINIMRLRFCNGLEYYLIDSEIDQLSAYNYDIIQTIPVPSVSTRVAMENVDGESVDVSISIILQARANNVPLLLDHFPDCNGETSCVPPVCDKTTEGDQDAYINGIYPSSTRTNNLSYPHTFTRVLLCSGLSVYLTEPELSNMPNQAYTIQHEYIVERANEDLNVQFADDQTGIFTLPDLLRRYSILDIFVVGDYEPCDDGTTDQCVLNFPCLEVHLWRNQVLNDLESACNNSISIGFPITLYRVVFNCPSGPSAIYLTEDEIAQLPGFYTITQTVLLDNPAADMRIIRNGQLETTRQSLFVQSCGRFNGVTAIEYGSCKIEEAVIDPGTGLRPENLGADCQIRTILQNITLHSSPEDIFKLGITGQVQRENSCNPQLSNQEELIESQVSLNRCASINYRSIGDIQHPFMAVSRTKMDAGYPIGLVSASYLRRTYPEMENDLQVDLNSFIFIDQAAKRELLTKVLNYSLSVEWGNLTSGIDAPFALPQVDITLLSQSVQLCLEQSISNRSSNVRLTPNGILIPPFQAGSENLPEAPLSLRIAGTYYSIQEGTTDLCPTLIINGEEQAVKIRVINDNGQLSMHLLESVTFTSTVSIPADGFSKDGTGSSTGYYLSCVSPSNIVCYNGNCDDVCHDLSNEEACTGGELIMLNAFLTSYDAFVASISLDDLSYPLRLNTVQFCNGVQRILLDDNLNILGNVAYRIISQQWVANKENAIILLDGGQISTGNIEDLFDIIPGNDDLSIMVEDESPGSPSAYDPIDPVTGQDPDNPLMEVTTPISYYLHDHLGNTRMIIRADDPSAMTITYAADYYPYGKILREWSPCEPERFLTTQHERDSESGYDNRGARLYDADVGRFLSVDPMAQDFAGWSGYNYVLGNPIYLIDPTGLYPEGWSESNIYLAEVFGLFGGGQIDNEVRDDSQDIIIDEDGNIVYAGTGNVIQIQHPSGPITEVEVGYIFANDGTPILVTRPVPMRTDPRFATNCHGTTFANGTCWLNNPEVSSVLRGDGYQEVSNHQNLSQGDVLVYFGQNGNADHSVTIEESTDCTLNSTCVTGLGGLETRIHTDSATDAWFDLRDMRIYRNIQGNRVVSNEEKQNLINSITGGND